MKTPLIMMLLGALISVGGVSTSSAQIPSSPAAVQVQFSQAQLDALLAPIALYPDTLLSHVLIASTYPLEVIQADRWVRNNSQTQGDAALRAVEQQDWDPSIKALVAFPDVLNRMSEDLDWTQQLGDAFLADEARLMDSIQGLRNKAYATGSLKQVEHVKVIREEKVIYIEPAVERVVYVPVYDTRVVYGNWWWADYPPVYWSSPASYVRVNSGFYWGPRVYISTGFSSGFFFSGCHWRDRRVVVLDRRHYSPRLNNNRNLVYYRDSRHWQHNPQHRRGVAYYDNATRQRFNSHNQSTEQNRVYRTQYQQAGNSTAARAGDRLRDAHSGTNNNALSNRAPGNTTAFNDRAASVRERLNNSPERNQAQRTGAQQPTRDAAPNRQAPALNNNRTEIVRDANRTPGTAQQLQSRLENQRTQRELPRTAPTTAATQQEQRTPIQRHTTQPQERSQVNQYRQPQTAPQQQIQRQQIQRQQPTERSLQSQPRSIQPQVRSQERAAPAQRAVERSGGQIQRGGREL